MTQLKKGPLAGVTVVAVEHAVAAPFATRQLADLGARVIKVERVDGGDFARQYDGALGGLSSVFAWVGRGKESLAVDLKSMDGRRAFDRLLELADVFIQNLSPGAMDRLGYTTELLRARFPRMVVVTNSGYGTPGPYGGKRAYDALVQCESGMVATTGTREHMVKPGFSAADIATGMYMYAGILMALYQREKTGEGTSVEVTMLDAITDWIGNHIYYAQHTGAPAQRVEMGHPSLAPYGDFPTADGQRIMIGVQNDREWARLCRALLRDESYITDARTKTNIERNRNREFVDALVARSCRELTADDLITLLDGCGVAVARINSLLQAAEHPQHLARSRWTTVGSSAGPIQLFKQVIDTPGLDERSSSIPALGEHTSSILLELGFSSAEVEHMAANGVARTSAGGGSFPSDSDLQPQEAP